MRVGDETRLSGEPPSKRKIPGWLSATLVLGAFATLLFLERRRPLRREVESKAIRNVRNLAVAGVGAMTLRLIESPVTRHLTTLSERRGWGLLKYFRLPSWLEVGLAILLLDYTLYVQHVLAHKVRFLWRFHAVHHVDLDLDASTALRFHFGELIISVPWRAAQIILIGVSPLAMSVWQTFLLISILFHHSNVRLPIAVERWLNRFIVTPRMHGIHHSIVLEERNSNWSGGFTLWDWLHGTLRLNVPQSSITIGVPGCREAEELGLEQILKMPFHTELPCFQLAKEEDPQEQYSLTSRTCLTA